jgi:valyl-tRNA synthetase
MPFISEELSRYFGKKKDFLLEEKWPDVSAIEVDNDTTKTIRTLQEIIISIRRMRNEFNFPARLLAKVIIRPKDDNFRRIVEPGAGLNSYFCRLAGLEKIVIDEQFVRPKDAAVAVVSAGEIFLPLAGLIDIGKEKQRLQKEFQATADQREIVKNKLANPIFLAKAPAAEVERIKNKTKELDWKLENLKNNLSYLE